MKRGAIVFAKLAASVLVLLVLVVGAGLGYAWYVGQHPQENSKAFAEPAGSAKPRDIKPAKIAPDAKVGIAIQSLTSPVAPGSNASVAIRTNPKAKCTIIVEYNKVASKDSGLVERVADDYGYVQWAWTVEPGTPLGTWPIKMVCANAKNSAFMQGDLIVKNAE